MFEGSEAPSAPIARDVEEAAALNVQGLSMLTGSKSLPEKREETRLGSKADSIGNLSAFILYLYVL